ncbi:hypothetical protein KI387_001126, partial [Taxus chinensis]
VWKWGRVKAQEFLEDVQIQKDCESVRCNYFYFTFPSTFKAGQSCAFARNSL